MKKIFISSILSVFVNLFAYATAPTASGSNLVFSNIDGKGFDASFTAGNGTTRIVVLKEGSPVTGLPVNGKVYPANSTFGTAGSEFTATGEYVIANTSWSSFSAQGLKPATTYYVAVFEFNGSGTGTEYLNVPLAGNRTTAVTPTVQATAVITTGSTGNTVNIAWTKGNGNGRIVLARKGAPVNASPADLTLYWDDAIFGNGTKVGADNYVVYKGAGSGVAVKNLEPNTTYYFTVFEYNGTTYPVFLQPGATASFTTNAGPTVAASAIGFNYVEGNRFTVSCTPGNGVYRLFVMKKGSAVTAVPVNGTNYTANATFGSGTEIAPGEFVIGNTTGNGIAVTNLEPGTTYYFRIFEYDMDKAGNIFYLTSSFATKSGSTVSAPTIPTSNLIVTSLNGNSASLSFTGGNGSYRMVIIKEGSAVDAKPTDLVQYNGNSVFGSGQQITPGNYVMYSGMNGSAFSVSNLKPGFTYHVAIFEFNGNYYPVYAASAGRASFTIPLEPTAASTGASFPSVDGGSLRMLWNSGNGANRIIIAKKGSAPTAKPVDGVNYIASGNFGEGDQLAPDEFVVYNGSYYYTDFKKLEIGTRYFFAVYEYNIDVNGHPDYLTTSWLAASQSTLSAPTQQAGVASVTGIQATTATVNYTKGNGDGRLIVMKEGSPVDALPQDYTKYSYSGTFGSGSTAVGNGNYVVYNTSSTGGFNVSNLKPKTTYYISAFEYNGNSEPVYQRTSPGTFSFTTVDVAGATTPTTASSNALTTSVDGNKLTLKWTSGNGTNRIVVMRKGSAVDFVPASATSYTSNPAFGSGTDLGGGQYVVYSGNGSSVDLTNLQPSSTYYFTVFEYNGTADLIRYLTSATLAGTVSTLAAPTVAVSNVNASAGNGSLTLSWTAGNGTARLIVMKEGSATTATPADLSVYPASAVFKSGSQMALGEYVIYAGSGNSVTVTGLGNKAYHYSIFEYNGTTAPVYNKTNPVGGAVVVSSTLPVSLVEFSARELAGKVELKWATAQEVNSNHFVVERSVDGISFSAIGNVQSAGNSATRKDYSFTDNNIPSSSKVYYRLQQVDNDAKTVYSSVQVVDVKKSGMNVSVYPNPFVSNFSVSLSSTQQARLTVYDASGKVQMMKNVKNGENIGASGLSAGTYFVTIEIGNEKQTLKLLKR